VSNPAPSLVSRLRANSSSPLRHSSLRWGLHRYTLLAGLLLAFAALLPFIAPTDLDLWWHLRTGQLIVDSGIPHVNDYSFTALGQRWTVYEWLSELIIYLVQQTVGYVGLALLFGAVQAGSGVLVYRLLRFKGAGRILALLLLLLFFIFAAPTWGVRPQIIAALFLAAYYLILLRYRRDPSRTRPLWLLPLLTALWANMHGTYVTGLALVALFIIGEAGNNFFYRPTRPTPLQPLLLTLAGCLVASLLNPYFIDLWLLPLGYVSTGGHNPLFYVDEWKPPDFHDYGNLLLAASFILLMLVGVGRRMPRPQRQRWRIPLNRRLDLTDALLISAFTVQALQGAYTAPLYGVIALPILAQGLARTMPALSRRGETPPPPIEGRVNWLLGAVGVVLLATLIITSPQAQTGPQPRLDTSIPYPAGAATYISKLPPNIRMYNDFGWGGYLIYRLYPQQRVFIDGRVDVYRGAVFEDFITVQNVGVGWRDILIRYGVNLVVIQRGSPLDYALAHEPGWHVGYHDDLAVIYQKN
jgi:hypothetical protein